MTCLYQVGKEPEEESHKQHTDMHSIDVGIGCYNHIVVSQIVHILVYVQGIVQQVQLFIAINELFALAV